MRTCATGVERAAQAMLRVLGAGKATLLIRQPTVPTQQTGLGVTAPLTNEVEMEPVLVQANVAGNILLAITTRKTIHTAVRSAGGSDAAETLKTAMLRAGATQYRIVSVTVKRFDGVEMLYELEIEE